MTTDNETRGPRAGAVGVGIPGRRGDCATEVRDGTPGIAFSTSRLTAIVNVPVLALVAWLLGRSLAWPLTGDAAIFHFMAGQFLIGLVPYRDLAEIGRAHV